MSRPAIPDYFRAVESTFLDLRGGGMFLTPADWDLVRRWEERGIPLDVVLSGIRAAFSGRIRVSSRMPLRECSREVQAAFDAKRSQRAGAAPPPGGETPESDEDAGNGLDRLADRLRGWSPAGAPLAKPEVAGDLVAAVRDAAAKVERRGRAGGASAGTEEVLKAMEADLLTRFKAALSDAAREEIENEVRNKLAPYRGRMPESTWQETFEAAVRRRVGKAFGLGSFTD